MCGCFDTVSDEWRENSCQLPVASCQLPVASCQLPVASAQWSVNPNGASFGEGFAIPPLGRWFGEGLQTGGWRMAEAKWRMAEAGRMTSTG